MAERTCVGCRAKAPRERLIRLVAGSDEIRVDAPASAAGRGVWVHPARGCLAGAQRKGRLLGKRIPSDLAEQVGAEKARRILAWIARLRAAGGLVLGRRAILTGECEAVLTAGPPPAWLEKAALHSLPVDREALGAAAGGPPRRAVGILSGRMSGGLARELADLREIG